MKYRQLANTGIFVSELCFGAMTFGGEGLWNLIGGLGQAEADRLVHRALDTGLNFFDTANVYGGGQSEEILAKSLGSRRQDVIIATKVRSRMGPGANQVGLSRVHIMLEIDGSLSRLQTDYIDLYQIHGFDPLTEMEDTLQTLDDLVRSGKVRYIGCSNLAAWQLMQALGISKHHRLESFKTTQSYYSIAGRDLEREMIPLLKDQKVGLLVWSPLAGGFLSGKFTRSNTSDEHARRAKFDFPPLDKEKGYAIIDVMQEVARSHEVSVAQIALAWLLRQDAVTSVIIGARRLDQLDDNLNAVNVELSDAELKQLDEVSQLTPEYPAWMLGLQSGRRPGESVDWERFARKES